MQLVEKEDNGASFIVRIPKGELEEVKEMAEYIMSDGHDGTVLTKVYEDTKRILEL